MRAERSLLLASVLCVLCGCNPAFLTRPEGTGGWSPERRTRELERISTSAGVSYDAAAGANAAEQATASTSASAAADSLDAPAAVPPTEEDAAASVARATAKARIAAPAGAHVKDDAASAKPRRGAAPRHVAPLASRAGGRRLDLESALALAARGNRRITEAGLQLQAAGERVMDVRGRLLPATTASARYTWYTDAQTTNVDLPAELVEQIGETPVVTVRDAENGTINGTIALPIDLSGELYHGLLAAQAGYRGEKARVWAVTLEQQLAVVRAYFELLEALRLREVAVNTAAVYSDQVAIADDRYKNGRLTKNDLLTFQVALRNAEQSILSRGVRIDRARLNLNDAIGADVDRATDPVDVRARPAVPSAEGALAIAWRQNPLLVSLLEEQQRLEETETSLARGRFPRFQGGGAMDYQSSDLLSPPQIGSGFVGFNWDIGTDLRRESQISEARIQAERNRVALERQMRELEAAVRSTQLAAQERIAAYDTAGVAVGQAEENLRIRRQQFDVGRAQSDDVLIAERLLASEQATLASALYQAHTRKAELQRLMGLPIDGE